MYSSAAALILSFLMCLTSTVALARVSLMTRRLSSSSPSSLIVLQAKSNTSNKNKAPTQSTPPPKESGQGEDKSKYLIAVGVFVAAACFDKFVYHADPAHDDALYKSSSTVKVIK